MIKERTINKLPIGSTLLLLLLLFFEPTLLLLLLFMGDWFYNFYFYRMTFNYGNYFF